MGALSSIVAAEVRAELARQQLSGIKAARALGWTQNYISLRSSGKTPFSLDDLEALARLLEVPVTRFFASEGARDFYSEVVPAGQPANLWLVAA